MSRAGYLEEEEFGTCLQVALASEVMMATGKNLLQQEGVGEMDSTHLTQQNKRCIKSRLSLIIQVNIVLNRTAFVDSD